MNTLIFDTETTGLLMKAAPIERQPKITEFFGLILDSDMKEDSTLHYYFNPGFAISDEISRITGLKNEALALSPKYELHAARIKNLIESVDVVVAHNLSFDLAMINCESWRCNLKIEWPRLCCTIESTEFIKGYRMSLAELHEYLFAESFSGAHRAENDVRALARCYIEMKKRGIVA